MDSFLDYGFTFGFTDSFLDSWIHCWIHGFTFGFMDSLLDSWIHFWIHGFTLGFLDSLSVDYGFNPHGLWIQPVWIMDSSRIHGLKPTNKTWIMDSTHGLKPTNKTWIMDSTHGLKPTNKTWIMDSTQGLKPTKPSKKVVNLQPCTEVFFPFSSLGNFIHWSMSLFQITHWIMFMIKIFWNGGEFLQ